MHFKELINLFKKKSRRKPPFLFSLSKGRLARSYNYPKYIDKKKKQTNKKRRRGTTPKPQ